MNLKDKLLYVFLLCLPFIDLVSSIATWEGFFSVGLIFKGFFLLYAGWYLLRNKSKYWRMFLFILLGCLSILIVHYDGASSLYLEIVNLIKIFYLPTLILFFYTYHGHVPFLKVTTYLALTYLLLYLGPYPFGLGHNIAEIYPTKNLYLAYFYVGNELANVFILLIPLAFVYFITNKQKVMTVILSFLTVCMLLLLGTKTMYISVFLILVYFGYRYFNKKKDFFKKNYKLIILGIVLVMGLGILVLPKTPIYQNFKTSLEFYEVDSVKELFTFQNINHVIYSNRLTFLENVAILYKDSSLSGKLFGIGRTTLLNTKDVEIDIFDIFFSIGMVGFIIYLCYFGYVLTEVKIKGLPKFIFILLLVISLFSGHVLISPMVSTYLAMLFGIKNGRNQNEKLDQKAIKKA